MVVADRGAHLARGKVENLAAGVVDHDRAPGRAEQIRKRVAAVADQEFLCSGAKIVFHEPMSCWKMHRRCGCNDVINPCAAASNVEFAFTAHAPNASRAACLA